MKKELMFQKIIDIKYKWCYVSILLFFIIFNQENSMSESKIENFKFENYKTADRAFEEYREKKFGTDFTKQLYDEDYRRIIDIRLKKQYKKDAMTDLLKLHPVGADVKNHCLIH